MKKWKICLDLVIAQKDFVDISSDYNDEYTTKFSYSRLKSSNT